MPEDIQTLFEKTQAELDFEKAKEKKEEQITLPTFDQKELLQYSEQ